MHPHTPQPFAAVDETTGVLFATGTDALNAALRRASPSEHRDAVYAAVTIPNDAKDAFELKYFAQSNDREGIKNIYYRR